MDPKGLPGVTTQGVRKAGATDAQVSAITGQTRQMVEHYGLMVNQRRLARDAILKWEESGERSEW